VVTRAPRTEHRCRLPRRLPQIHHGWYALGLSHSFVRRLSREPGHNSHKLWGNTEVREYTFASEDDEDALLVPVRKVVQEGADNPTSSSKKFTY
jgi:hypothetical protein